MVNSWLPSRYCSINSCVRSFAEFCVVMTDCDTRLTLVSRFFLDKKLVAWRIFPTQLLAITRAHSNQDPSHFLKHVCSSISRSTFGPDYHDPPAEGVKSQPAHSPTYHQVYRFGCIEALLPRHDITYFLVLPQACSLTMELEPPCFFSPQPEGFPATRGCTSCVPRFRFQDYPKIIPRLFQVAGAMGFSWRGVPSQVE